MTNSFNKNRPFSNLHTNTVFVKLSKRIYTCDGIKGEEGEKKEKETIRFEVTTNDDAILYSAHERLERFDWNSVETSVRQDCANE